MKDALAAIVDEIRGCRLCAEETPHEPAPVIQASSLAKIAIFSQAPGVRAHRSGRPFTDPSGVRLRDWLQVTEAEFYDENRFLIAPMGFCFPGNDSAGGDLPPLKRCAATWRDRLMAALPQFELCLLVGGYAQTWHLRERAAKTLTETVKRWRDYGPRIIPMPHPSWRNNAWIRKNPWFEQELLPHLRARVAALR